MPTHIDKEILEERFRHWRERKAEEEAAYKARIARFTARQKALGELKVWLKKRGLERHDLLMMYQAMAPKREDKPVKSKKPLHPEVVKARNSKGIQPGNGHPKRGDPAFAAAMKKAMAEQGYGTESMAAKIGVSNASISNWRNLRYIPTEEARLKVCRALGLPEDLGKEVSLEMERNQGKHSHAATQ